MSERKDDRIKNTKEIVWSRDGYRCQYRNERGVQCCDNGPLTLAHRIGKGHTVSVQTKWNGEFNEDRDIRFIENRVMHHPLNLVTCCTDLNHNDSFNIGFNPGAVRERLYAIHEQLQQSGVIK